jgi:hypothetical protein
MDPELDPSAQPAPPPTPMEEPSLAQPDADPHEAAWLSDRDAAQEAVFAHVGAGLLIGGGQDKRKGRNLLTEAEHAHSARAARDLLAPDASGTGENAEELAGSDPRQAGIAYLRDNSDALQGTLSTRQAKAAQKLLDSYGELAHLRSSPDELDAMIPPGKGLEQARWVSQTKVELAQAVRGAPDDVRELASQFGRGGSPAEWFAQASELSDTLAKAAVKARRTDEATATRLEAARSLLEEGAHSEAIWGQAAKVERQRSAGYSKRYGDHIDAFEEAFTSRVGDAVKADPAKFREFVEADQSGDRAQALTSMLASARATADAAARFGKPAEARGILAAASQLEKALGRSRTVRAASGGVPRETAADASQAALAFLGGEAEPATPDATRAGVLKATGAMTVGFAASRKAAVAQMLSPVAPGDDDEEPLIADQTAPMVTHENFGPTRRHIEQMATDPDYFGRVMEASFGRLGEAAPEVYRALSAQTAKTVNYLHAVAPGGNSGGPFSESYPVADDELWEFNQRVRTGTDPTFIPGEIAAGRVSATAMEAFQVLSPRQYSKLQLDVYERLHELKSQGIDIPIQAREQLDTVLGLDGGGETALTWNTAEKAEAARLKKAQTSSLQPSDKPSGHASSMTSGALSSLNNGASAIARSGT